MNRFATSDSWEPRCQSPHLVWCRASQVEVRECKADHFFYKTVPKTPDGPTQHGAFAKAHHPPSTLQESPCHFAVGTPSCFQGSVIDLPLVRTIFSSAVHWSKDFLVTATLMVQEKIPQGEVIGKYIGQITTHENGMHYVRTRSLCSLKG